ncbi:hypothetical protein FE257_010578 [Aspergillus nanangensis]|uniref:NmrA-like domain-containing protein n=1 Tax=Aspergillus nanangensis TaxID=2582783 RepID=A0AAD4GR60_ASPNN|nr:hypothetical protein FE257_010578 [Aspergillus nanangensis]
MSNPKIAIAGASGNLGPAVLSALLEAGFTVTVLTRAGQKGSHQFDRRAQVAKVDYQSQESLISALRGHDAVVNTLGTVPRPVHLGLIDAAVAAHVPRFIPSEFGMDSAHPKASAFPIYADKVAVQKYLQEKAAASGGQFAYTFLINDAVELYDGGDRKFSATTLAGVGKAICGIIRNLEATRNRTVYVREVDVSQNQLLGMLKTTLPTKVVDTEELERNAWVEFKKPNPPLEIFLDFIRRNVFGEGYGGLLPAEALSNQLLGVREFSQDELEKVVRDCGN